MPAERVNAAVLDQVMPGVVITARAWTIPPTVPSVEFATDAFSPGDSAAVSWLDANGRLSELKGTEPPARRTITMEGTPGIAAGDDRVIVTGNSTQLFDARAEPVDVAFAPLPEFIGRASFSAGRFVLVSGNGTITLLDARSGSSLATWGGPGIHDAVVTGNTIVAVDLKGTVHVGCVAGNLVRAVAQASAGSVADIVQVVGDRVVVSANGPDPVRVATLTSPCPP